MRKKFIIYNFVPESDANGIEVSTIEEVYSLINKYWNVGSSQIQFDYNKYAKTYDVKLRSKTDETFVLIGDINFNPYE